MNGHAALHTRFGVDGRQGMALMHRRRLCIDDGDRGKGLHGQDLSLLPLGLQ